MVRCWSTVAVRLSLLLCLALCCAAMVPSRATAGDTGYVGVVMADHVLDLAGEIAGRVTALAADLGDSVAAGAVLVRLDDRWIRHDLARARADLAAAAADSARAAASLDLARRRWSRRRDAGDAWSEEERDDARFAVADAEGAVAQARARLAAARAAVARLQDRLAETVIRAPFAATVAARYVEPGQHVAAGAPLLRLVGTGPPYLRCTFPAAALPSPGDTLLVDAGGTGERRRAVVRRIAREIAEGTGLVWVEAELVPAAAPPLLPGQQVTVRPAGPATTGTPAPAGRG